MTEATKELLAVLGKFAFVAVGMFALYHALYPITPTPESEKNGAALMWLVFLLYTVVTGLFAIFVLRSVYRVIKD
jgi:ABC-type branched-subunit amino acid transport system permease subunit